MARSETAKYLGAFSTNVYCRLRINHPAWNPLPLRPTCKKGASLFHRGMSSPHTPAMMTFPDLITLLVNILLRRTVLLSVPLEAKPEAFPSQA